VITRMEVVSDRPDAPDLPLGGFMPNNEAIQIRNIEGLGPVKADIASTPFATGRGELYQGVSVPKRNIVLTLGLNPNYASQSMASLRQLLYAYFMPENWARYRFISDELPTVFINGIVESFEPNIFSQDPEIQVSIICPKPDFIDVNTTLLSGTVDDGTTETTVNYLGTVPTGFELKIQPSATLASYSGDLTIKNVVRGEEQIFKIQSVNVDSSMYVDLNTVRASRYVYNVSPVDESAIDILAKIARNPVWPELNSGENVLSFAASTPGLDWHLGYFQRFGGL
jgi:Phage tail protein